MQNLILVSSQEILGSRPPPFRASLAYKKEWMGRLIHIYRMGSLKLTNSFVVHRYFSLGPYLGPYLGEIDPRDPVFVVMFF